MACVHLYAVHKALKTIPTQVLSWRVHPGLQSSHWSCLWPEHLLQASGQPFTWTAGRLHRHTSSSRFLPRPLLFIWPPHLFRYWCLHENRWVIQARKIHKQDTVTFYWFFTFILVHETFKTTNRHSKYLQNLHDTCIYIHVEAFKYFFFLQHLMVFGTNTPPWN